MTFCPSISLYPYQPAPAQWSIDHPSAYIRINVHRHNGQLIIQNNVVCFDYYEKNKYILKKKMDLWQEDEALTEVKIGLPVCQSSVLFPGIVSPIASVMIHLAYLTEPSLPIEQGVETWRKETSGPLRAIFKSVRAEFPDKIMQTMVFVLRVAHWLRAGSLDTSIRRVTCPYDITSSNFIKSLAVTKTCQCSCYTWYLLSALEEFGLTDNAQICLLKEHMSFLIVDPRETVSRPIDAKEQRRIEKKVNRVLKQRFLTDSEEARKLLMPRIWTFQGPKILANIELATAEDVFYVIVADEDYGWPKDAGWEIIVGEMPPCRFQVLTKWLMFTYLFYEIVRSTTQWTHGIESKRLAAYLTGCAFDAEPFIDLFMKLDLINQRYSIANMHHYRDIAGDLKQRIAKMSLRMIKWLATATLGMDSQKMLITELLQMQFLVV